MITHCLYPFAVLASVTLFTVLSLDKMCTFHSAYLTNQIKLDCELWLLDKCKDPIFFSHLNVHSDLCLTLENNYSIGAFMMALNHMAGSFRLEENMGHITHTLKTFLWPLLAVLAGTLIVCPSLLVKRNREFNHMLDARSFKAV